MVGTVSVLFDSVLVDQAGEATNIDNSVKSSFATTQITTYANWIASLSGVNTAVIPELERGRINLSPTDKAALEAFLAKPGRLLIAGSSFTVHFLNQLDGVSVSNGPSLSNYPENANRAGSIWASNPNTALTAANAVKSIDMTAITSPYTVGYGPDNGAVASQFEVGGGEICYLGFDWYEAPTPVDWQSALNNCFGV